MRHAAALALVASLALAGAARACGVCLEDKVAAAYDHAVLTRALDRGRAVVFAEVKGERPAEALVAAARRAARSVRGIERASVRAANAPASLSFVLDPGVRSPADALAAVERAAGPGVRLQLLKVVR